MINELNNLLENLNFRKKYNICKYSNCTKRCCYGFERPIVCKEHSIGDIMIDVKNKRCIHDDCNKQPLYNYLNEKKALYCNEHKLDDMIDVTHKRCKTYLCDTFVTNKYKGYCLRCFIYNFPESKLIEFIKENFKDSNIIYNKQTGGCSKRRFELILDL